MAESILLYVSTDDGLIILSKPGTSKEWLPPRRALPGEPIGAAAAVPGPPIQVFAVRRDTGTDFLMSTNGGRTWSPAPASADPFALIPSDSVPPTIAAPLVIPAMKQGVTPVQLIVAEGDLQRSEDEGSTWSIVVPDPAAPSPVTALAPDPERRERIYAGTQAGQIYTSADRGKTWARVEVPPLPPINHIFVLRIG
jgi:photosystem II stability/assembly factor-like uncharacterized protein